MEPDCVSCARPMPVPPALGGMWSSTLSPQGCGKSEKMMGPSTGPRSWQRGFGFGFGCLFPQGLAPEEDVQQPTCIEISGRAVQS